MLTIDAGRLVRAKQKDLLQSAKSEIIEKSVPENLHNSLIDVYVCFRCFYKLIYESDYNEKNPVFSRRYKILSSI